MLKAILYVVTWLFILHNRSAWKQVWTWLCYVNTSHCHKTLSTETVFFKHEPSLARRHSVATLSRCESPSPMPCRALSSLVFWFASVLSAPIYNHKTQSMTDHVFRKHVSGCRNNIFYWWLCFLNMSHNLNASWNVGLYSLLSSLPLCT